MANQVIVTNTGNVQVALTPPPNVQVQISRAAIGTISNVPTANFANYAANVTSSSQPNITSLGTLSNLSVSGNSTINNLVVTGNLTIANLIANSANYANFAGIANTANSVTLANVSGAGNIASINLDGSNSNVLYGNGVFATINIPPGDQISNGTSNVSIPVANSNVQVYANNQHWTFTDVGNLLLAGGNGVIQSIANSSLDPINPNVSTMVLTPDQGNSSQALVLDPTTPGHIHLRAPGSNIDQPQANVYLGGEISSFEVGVFNGAVPNLFIHSNNKTWTFDIDGNLTLPANTFAINYANGTQVPLDGPVANANYANFAGTAFSVSGSNVSGEVANANYASYANIAATANSVTLANVSGIGNIANINLDGSSSNVLFGNGVFAPESTSIANANYANFAGTVITNAQPNITSVGNLPYLQVSNSSNADGVINQFGSNNITFSTNFANLESYQVTTLYSPNSSASYPAQRIIRSRGNATTPTTAVANDRITQNAGYVYNGITNVFAVGYTYTATGTVNANANAAYTGGQYVVTTGNPSGDIGNANALSPQNVLIFSNSGTLSIAPGTPANSSLGQSSSSLVVTNYGATTANLVPYGGLNFQRARGNRDSVQNIQAGDQVGRSVFYGYSNGAYQSSNVAQYNVTVDSSYVANDVVIPLSHNFQTVANVGGVATFRTTRFYANGTTALPGNINFTTSTANLFTGSSGQVALGIRAGLTSQTTTAVAIGTDAGSNAQAAAAVALGQLAGSNTQGMQGVAVGYLSGAVNQGEFSIAIGGSSGGNAQGRNAVAIGVSAASETQGNNSVAIGNAAGYYNQGANSVAIGAGAGSFNQANNTIILNASGANLDQTTANTFTVKPVRNANTANVLYYNNTTGEITYDVGGGGGGTPGGSNTQLQFNNAGSFGGISTVTYDGSNISLGAVGNVKITGGVNNEVMRTDGTGNLSFTSIAQNLLVGTRAGPYTVPITNYTFQVTTRSSGNVTVYVN